MLKLAAASGTEGSKAHFGPRRTTTRFSTFLLRAGSAIQEVAVHGFAVNILPDRKQRPASSFMFGG